MQVLLRPDSPDVARLMGLRNVFRATVAGADAQGLAVLDWAGLHVATETRLALVATETRLALGGTVDWAVPEAFVKLHRSDRPTRDGRENPVPGVIAEAVPLGQTVSLTLRPDHAPDQPLRLSAPLHLAAYVDLTPGARATVSLTRRGVRVMGAPPSLGSPQRTRMRRDGAPARPAYAFGLGAVVGTVGGLIGLGGAEFRLPALVGPLCFAARPAATPPRSA